MEKRTMTEGKVWQNILWFALPLLGTSFIQQLYNTVDLIFVGNFLGIIETAAVGASSLFVTCLIGLFSGVSLGAVVLAGMAFGKKDYKTLNLTIHNAVTVAMACGFLVMGLGLVGAPYFLSWVKTPMEAQPFAIAYMRIYFLSSTAMLVYNMSSGIIRALGNSKAPMYYQLAGGILNIFLNAVFILVFKLGVVGVALSTLISQSMTAAMALYHLSTLDEAYRFSLKKMGVNRPVVRKIIKIGLPVGFQALVVTLSNVFVQYHVNQLGLDELAAFTAYFKIELLIYLPILAMGQSISVFTSQNIGAKQLERVRKGTLVGLSLGMGVTIMMILVVYLLRRNLLGFILLDPNALALGARIIEITVPFYWIYLILEVLGSTIRGAGKTFASMVIVLLNICVLRSVILFTLMSFSTKIENVAVVYPITWALTALMMAVYFLKANWMGTIEEK